MQYRVYATTFPSVCPSVTRVHIIRTAEHVIEIILLCDRSINLVFHHQGLLCKSDGLTPNAEGDRIQRAAVAICGYISKTKTVIDRGIFTIEAEYKVVCALSNSAAFDDLEGPRTPASAFQGHSIV